MKKIKELLKGLKWHIEWLEAGGESQYPKDCSGMAHFVDHEGMIKEIENRVQTRSIVYMVVGFIIGAIVAKLFY